MRVLDVGTGSGYQAAVLAELGAQVYSIERIPELASGARRALSACGYSAVSVRSGDGSAGWPDAAPFERILAACATPRLPPVPVDELADGGRLVLPVGGEAQRLVLVRRCGQTVEQQDDLWVRFVPMLWG